MVAFTYIMRENVKFFVKPAYTGIKKGYFFWTPSF
jgi:hypothetical protein